MQKILRAILEEGFEEGRLLLQDWLTIFIANFTRNTSEFKKIDLEFQKYPNLKFLCHELFGLSKSVILNPKLYHPDQWSYYHVLFR